MSDRLAPAAPARSARPAERHRLTAATPVRAARHRTQSRVRPIVLVAFIASSIGLMAAPAATLGWSPNAFNSASEQQLMALTNQARASAGRKALRWDSALGSIARWRSKDMIKRDYFSHDIPGAGKVFDEMSARGYCYKVAGENIGWNTYPDDVATAQIQSMFMGSSGHRANILGKDWDHIGIGAYKGADGKKMWTVLFADRCGSGPVASKPKAKPPTAAKPRTTKPKATPKPKPKPTPTATPTLAPPDQLRRLGPDDDGGTVVGAAVGPAGPAVPIAISSRGSLRVVDRPPAGGLLESIVGGIAGFFLGG